MCSWWSLLAYLHFVMLTFAFATLHETETSTSTAGKMTLCFGPFRIEAAMRLRIVIASSSISGTVALVS